MNKKTTIITVSIIAAVLLVIGVSYAWFTLTVKGNKTNVIQTGELSMVIENELNEISLKDAFPIMDDKGKLNTPTEFTLRNNGSKSMNYTVKLVEDEDAKSKCTGCKFIPASMIRYEITVDASAKDINNLTSNGTVLDTGLITKGQSIKYKLKIWLDINATDEAQKALFYGKIEIEGVQRPSEPEYVDGSGASIPELDEGMIPVIYDAGTSNWVKADKSKEWFNYDKQNWANVVTVTSTNRNTLLAAPAGTVIPMTDINTMMVWIPRYSYTIGNTYGVQGYGGSTPSALTPGAIDIKFVKKTDPIENGTAKYTGSTADNWYTHPAFCFGTLTTVNNRTTCDGTEVNGIWVAKFEASAPETDLCTITPNNTNCNKSTIQPIVKPNMSSWRYVNVSNMFASIKDNMNGLNGNNTYGLNVTDGDSHMMKNSEWGALAYLTQSKYGKYGNILYTEINKEIYINNYISVSGAINVKMITGCSAGAPSTGESIGGCTYRYNKIADRGNGKGSGGAGASTTGNIYGIYDMSGAGWEYVMANYNNSLDSSGFISMPSKKYYDLYTGATGLKGDATNADGTKNWYDDPASHAAAPNPWAFRGGNWKDASYAGIFYSDSSSGYGNYLFSFRFVRTPII